MKELKSITSFLFSQQLKFGCLGQIWHFGPLTKGMYYVFVSSFFVRNVIAQ